MTEQPEGHEIPAKIPAAPTGDGLSHVPDAPSASGAASATLLSPSREEATPVSNHPAPEAAASAPPAQGITPSPEQEPTAAPEVPPPAESAPPAVTPPPSGAPKLPVLPPMPEPTRAPEATSLGIWLLLAVIAVGILQFALNIAAPLPNRYSLNPAAVKVGLVLGHTFIWPAIVIALFSIGRRFRNARSRAFILLGLWTLVSVGAVERLARERRTATIDRFVQKKLQLNQAPSAQSSPQPSPMLEPGEPPAADARVDADDGTVLPNYDFSPGSDQRLIALIEKAQESEYHRVVAAYARACAARPDDAALALERVKFIERFAYSEDVSIESASDDHDRAVDYLTRRFPDVPGTVLYQLGSLADDEFDALAGRHARVVARWPAADRAKFYLLRARAANHRDAKAAARLYAEDSFKALATVEAGLVLAQAQIAADQAEKARATLLHPVFEQAEPWDRKQKMDLLFDLKETALALALYEELKKTLPAGLRSTEMTRRLADAGMVEEARTVLAAIQTNDWNRDDIQDARFRFELDFGTPESALQAYRERTDTAGLMADPLLGDRLALFRRHPLLGWNMVELVCLAFLGLSLAVAFASPLVILAPIHYWSLLRTRKGRTGAWPDARWGLRSAWGLFGLLAVAQWTACLIFAPGWIRSLLQGTDTPLSSAATSLLSIQVVVWIAGSVGLAFLWVRARAWSVLGAGGWGIGKAFAVGIGGMIAMRLALRLYVLFWPGAIGADFAAESPLILQLSKELIQHTGTLGLLFTVGLFVPVFEEMLFRGVALQAMARHIPFGWANLVQAVGFAALHENLALLPFFTAFGLTCGVLARRSGGILAPVILHAGNNLVACIAVIRLQSYLS
jgi:uncharacterized protein